MSNGIDNDCPDCARMKQLLIDAEDATAELGRQVAGLQGLLTRAGKTEVALRNELARQREEEPEADAIKAVLNHWKRTLGHERAKTPLSGERAKRVRARLRERFTVEDLKLAVDGCAKVPYVGAGGRKPTGTLRERHDDLKLICQDETTVERFMGYAASDPPPAPTTAPPRHPRPVGPTGVQPLLDRLEAVKETKPNQWNARCPAHEDRHASLSVAQGEKGALVHCHAGCTADAIAHAAGLDISALFDYEPPAPRPAPKPRDPLPTGEQVDAMAARLQANPKLLDRLLELRGWHPAALTTLGVGYDGARLTLPVYDATHSLVNVVRYLPRRTGDAPKTLAAKGHPRDLFPAPETIDGSDVWLVEGEPDAITGHELGLPAVAVPGVNGWRTDWAPRFTDRTVTICMDCDDHGRQAAQRILTDLTNVTTARVLDLEPERDDGYDLTDALLEGADPELLRVMADAIREQKVAA